MTMHELYMKELQLWKAATRADAISDFVLQSMKALESMVPARDKCGPLALEHDTVTACSASLR
jgi:hypothetical protein